MSAEVASLDTPKGSGPKIALLYAEGEIVPRQSVSGYDLSQVITERLADQLIELKEDKEADLESFKDDVRKLLEKEIILRYHYYGGVARHVSLNDPEVHRAVEVLKNGEEYRRILTSQDTPRNAE